MRDGRWAKIRQHAGPTFGSKASPDPAHSGVHGRIVHQRASQAGADDAHHETKAQRDPKNEGDRSPDPVLRSGGENKEIVRPWRGRCGNRKGEERKDHDAHGQKLWS